MKRLLRPNTLLHRQSARLHRYLHRRTTRLGTTDILQALRCLGTVDAPALMVHSSLSACGQIEGGAPTVIDALRAWAGPVTMAMPAHSYCYPRDGKHAPCFDPASTPSAVGAISELFRRQPGVVRSLHPSHSLAASGPLAEAICAGHDWAGTPCGRGTPYERLVQRDSAVLMFGATLEAYTFFHTAEDAAGVTYLYLPEQCNLACRDADGIAWAMPSLRHDMTVPRRFAEMALWLEEQGLLHRGRLGLGELLFMPHAAAVHQALVAEMKRDPWFLVSRHPTSAVDRTRPVPSARPTGHS